MSRWAPITIPLVLALALGWGVGCSLLDPYPGGKEPASVLAGSNGGRGTFDRGESQEPLVDPAVDPSLVVTSNVQEVLAHPGSAFLIDLDFNAPNMNVVGGGISFGDSDEVQWTFIAELEGESIGNIRFGFVVDESICAEVSNLCLPVATKQFAVARNTAGDVDGDGKEDGEFVVSPPRDVTVVLMCSTCESPSCMEVFEDLAIEDQCQSCSQPQVCQAYYDRCLDPTANPSVAVEDVAFFDGIFGPNGALWTTPSGCVAGEQACVGAEAEGTECQLGGGDEGGESSGGSGG